MDSKLIGGILLIVGTSIGAGMLALPVAAAEVGFPGALALLVLCWFVMTAGAFLLLEVNLWLPQNTNIISMAKATIGPIGQAIAWITYLLLLYSLLCAYIAGGSDLFQRLLANKGVAIQPWLASLLFTFIFGCVVYLGIRSVDYLNRGLMFVKMGAYFLLVVLLMPFVSLDLLAETQISGLTSAAVVTVTITSFGFAIIVPSLRIYFGGNVKKLKTAIIIGSAIPLLCYIAWDIAIMGVLPLNGDGSLSSILQSKNSTSDLITTLNSATSTASIAFFTKLFISICVLTSFLSVALCLTDFLADGLKQEKTGLSGLFIQLVTFIPPLMIVLFFPGAFIKALQYAGIYCVILLILLPAWMAWAGRYQRLFKGNFRLKGGKALLVLLMLFGSLVIIRSMF